MCLSVEVLKTIYKLASFFTLIMPNYGVKSSGQHNPLQTALTVELRRRIFIFIGELADLHIFMSNSGLRVRLTNT